MSEWIKLSHNIYLIESLQIFCCEFYIGMVLTACFFAALPVF